MYAEVAKMQPVARIYEKDLLERGLATQSQIDNNKQQFRATLEDCYVKSKSLKYNVEEWMTEEWGTITKYAKSEAAISGVQASKL